MPSSSLLASSGLYWVYFFAHSSPGKYGCHGAGTPWRASPRPRKTDSLIWSRLIAWDSAIRNSFVAMSLPSSGSALYDWLNATTASAPPKVGHVMTRYFPLFSFSLKTG